MNLIDLFRNGEPHDPRWDGEAWEPEPTDHPKNDSGRGWFLKLFFTRDSATIGAVSDEAVKRYIEKHNVDLDTALKHYADKFNSKRGRRRKR